MADDKNEIMGLHGNVQILERQVANLTKANADLYSRLDELRRLLATRPAMVSLPPSAPFPTQRFDSPRVHIPDGQASTSGAVESLRGDGGNAV